MKHIVTLLFVIVGLINFAPLVGSVSNDILASLYAVEINSPDMSLLLRHRAVLFGIVGGYILVAAFKPKHRPTASIMGFASMLSFIVLYWIISPENSKLFGVFRIDVIAVILLTIAVLLDRRRTAGLQ